MGIPAFYRWLVTKYPLAVVDVLEEVPITVNGVNVPVDTSEPNPNGMEFDNLYLDMNGIIHPCFHPEGQLAPKTYELVFKAVFKYIDRIFAIIRPRKLLYLAIDGVAPRAKMNQQRGRRFRAAKDAADAALAEERLRSVFESEGEKLAVLEQTQTLDSNVITPGTEFMATLSSALQYYIHLRMNSDPGWRGIKVILSDANVPGEGEHKIMSYIRLQRNLPGFDPNTRHCLYGLDADLIMLALATHEIHFSILREDVRKAQANDKSRKFRKDSTRTIQQDENKELKPGEVAGEDTNDYISRQQFQFLNIWVLRDYLLHDMRIPDSAVTTDLERLIDDFVFMCLFVGNDFLPHMPSLEISEGAIDLLMAVYKKEFVRMGGYLTDSFEVNLERVEHFIQVVGSHESAIFRRRIQVQKEREKRFQGGHHYSNRKLGKNKDSSMPLHVKDKQNSSSTKELQSFINNATPDNANALVDNIKLGEEGWKERFYAEKFEAMTKDEREKIRRHAVLKYIEGICWVMCYYYQGVCSWQWFYPYHYAPFASDFYHLERLEIHFTLGEPFKPFDQLMGVLPAASAHALPLFYRKLMTDSSSPILDFYPNDFELDMDGKRFAWQAIVKLPFIKESRLLAEIAKVEQTLTDEEMKRNSLGLDVLFVHISHPLAAKIFSFCKRKKDHPKLSKAKVKRKIDPKFSDGMNGCIYISDKPVWPLEIYSPIEDMEIVTRNKVISVFYKYPLIHLHIPRPPEGVVIPRMFVRKKDLPPAPLLWHEQSAVLGRVYSERPVQNSISGSCLAKLSHRLVLEHYHGTKQKIVGPAEQDGHITRDVLSCQPNSKEMGHEKKMEDAEGIHVNGTKPGKRKQGDQSIENKKLKIVGPAEIDGHITRDVSCQLNSEEMVHKKKLDGEESHRNGTELGKRKWDGPSSKPGERKQSDRSIESKKLKTAGPAELNGHITKDVSVHEKKMGDMVKKATGMARNLENGNGPVALKARS